MHQKQNSGQGRFSSRPSHPARPGTQSRPSRPGTGQSYNSYKGSSPRPHGGHSSRSRFGGRKQTFFKDVSKFINKAEPVAEATPYASKHAFTDFPIDETLKKNIARSGYKAPTSIQDQAILPALVGRDVLGIANTGTGKTAAFLIPLINKVIQDRKQNVIVVAPTRELALQINHELSKFSFGLSIFSVGVVGGMPIGRQMNELRRSHNFVVGTPGRIKDLIERGSIKMERFHTIVLDEADRMLDMGFIGDMRYLMTTMPKSRQTLFFSATLSPDIRKIIGEFLTDPVTVSVKTGETSKAVDQDVVYVKGKPKLDLLHDLLTQKEFNKVLVFGRTKHGVERLAKVLAARGLKAESIHGNKNHGQRQRALRAFKDGDTNILVATDVAARGLDIPNVSHVINFELPATHDDYVHRIGRTGRGGKMGKALTFIE